MNGDGPPAPDLDKCPKCGGPADNGHDREIPPTPYYCTRCEAGPNTDHPDDILDWIDRAKATVMGPRQAEYGDPGRNFRDIAKIWSVLLGTDVCARDVVRCMNALKLVRDARNPKDDNPIDIIGYWHAFDMGRHE